MVKIVDTSVWIKLCRQPTASLKNLLNEMAISNQIAITGQIYVEFLGSFKQPNAYKKYKSEFDLLPFIEVTKNDYKLASEMMGALKLSSAGDSIIAAPTIINKLQLLTYDKDFLKYEKFGLNLQLLQN